MSISSELQAISAYLAPFCKGKSEGYKVVRKYEFSCITVEPEYDNFLDITDTHFHNQPHILATDTKLISNFEIPALSALTNPNCTKLSTH